MNNQENFKTRISRLNMVTNYTTFVNFSVYKYSSEFYPSSLLPESVLFYCALSKVKIQNTELTSVTEIDFLFYFGLRYWEVRVFIPFILKIYVTKSSNTFIC